MTPNKSDIGPRLPDQQKNPYSQNAVIFYDADIWGHLFPFPLWRRQIAFYCEQALTMILDFVREITRCRLRHSRKKKLEIEETYCSGYPQDAGTVKDRHE